MKNWNETFRSLNVGLPDDVERLKAKCARLGSSGG